MTQEQRKNSTKTVCGLGWSARLLDGLAFRDALKLLQERFPPDRLACRLPRGFVAFAWIEGFAVLERFHPGSELTRDTENELVRGRDLYQSLIRFKKAL